MDWTGEKILYERWVAAKCKNSCGCGGKGCWCLANGMMDTRDDMMKYIEESTKMCEKANMKCMIRVQGTGEWIKVWNPELD